MLTAQEIRAAALVTGRNLKRKNALTAFLCGAVPGLIAALFIHMSPSRWALGILIGLLWSNAFEYFYHRCLLHWPKSSFGQGHLLHHLTTGKPDEAEQVTFGSSPLWVAALFAVNGIPTVLVDWRLSLGLAPGILVGFSAYMIAVEEIHWRVHLGGWVPGMSWIREYHLAHHDIPGGRFNVFFPVFDYIFGNVWPAVESTNAAAMARAVVRSSDQRENPFLAALSHAAVWLWLFGMVIGARYFWTTKTRL